METNMELGMEIEMELKNDMERACEMGHTKRQFGKLTTHTRAHSPTHTQGSPTHTRVLQHTLLACHTYRFSYTTIKNPYSLRSLLGNHLKSVFAKNTLISRARGSRRRHDLR